MSNPVVIGSRLKNLRLKAKETVKEISDAINVSESAWRMYEIGQRVPRDEVKERIANHYNTSIELIFFND